MKLDEELSPELQTRQTEGQRVSTPKSPLGNWVFLSMCAVICFVASMLSIDSMTHLGLSSCYYYNTGAFTLCLSYFIVYYCQFNYNDDEFVNVSGKRRNLLTKENGAVDWKMLAFYIIGACLQISVFCSISTTFLYS